MAENYNKYKQDVKKRKNEFTASVVEQDKDWVQDRRLEFLNNEQTGLKAQIIHWYNIKKKAESWFAEVIDDLAKESVKKYKRNQREIDSWITPVYGSNWIESSDIELAAEGDFSEHIEIKRNDHNREWALCPFHQEKTPSFCISKDTNKFHCFGCAEHGSVIDLVRKIYGMEFPEAVRFILKK